MCCQPQNFEFSIGFPWGRGASVPARGGSRGPCCSNAIMHRVFLTVGVQSYMEKGWRLMEQGPSHATLEVCLPIGCRSRKKRWSHRTGRFR